MVSKDSSRFSILDNLCAMFPSIAASESSNLSIICKKGKIYFTYICTQEQIAVSIFQY